VSNNQLVKSDLGQLPAAMADLFAGQAKAAAADLTTGVMAGFPTISYRGKVWRIRKGGEEQNYVDANGDAVQSLELVLVKATPTLAKVFYKAAFEEGSTGKPDCWSADGIKPDANVQEPVCATCAACPNNVWGSRISEQGKKGKLCADRRRMAVVGPQDLAANGADCEKLLLHAPAGSLKGLKEYAEKVLQPKGVPYYAVVTRVGFDVTQAHPQLTFRATRFLTESEARAILEIRDGDEVARILQESHEFDGTADAAAQEGEGIAGTMPAAMSGKVSSDLSAGVAAPQQAATRVAPAAAPTSPTQASPPAARQTAVEAELMPEAKPKKTRKAGATAPAEPVTVAQSTPAATPPPAAATDFDAMLDSILG
jgi:hypothetical protein